MKVSSVRSKEDKRGDKAPAQVASEKDDQLTKQSGTLQLKKIVRALCLPNRAGCYIVFQGVRSKSSAAIPVSP